MSGVLCIDSNIDNSSSLVWERDYSIRWAPRTLPHSLPHPSTILLPRVLYRWRRDPTRSTSTHTAREHCCMDQAPVNMDIENEPGHIKCQGKPPNIVTTLLASDSLHLSPPRVHLTGTSFPRVKGDPPCSLSIPNIQPTDVSSSLAEGHFCSQIQVLLN